VPTRWSNDDSVALLVIGNFASNAGVIKVGGYIGIATAAIAWYASAAGVINKIVGKVLLKVGGPMRRPAVLRGEPVPR
jgi:succinate-acetate transporter protein